MGIFDRIGNLGKGVVGMWKRDSGGPSGSDLLDAELDAARRKARVDAQLARMKSTPADEAPPSEGSEPTPDTTDRPIKKTL